MLGKQEFVTIGKYSATLKPKYRDISLLLGEDYSAPNGIDIFLDFNTLISSISNYQKYMNQIPFMDQKNIELDIISTILTTFLHWKNYTRKTKWEKVRIFGILNDLEMGLVNESSQLKSYLIPYVNKFRQDRFKQLNYYWTQSIKTVEKILKYVPGMYLLHCNKFDSYVIPNIIDNYSDKNIDRLVISNKPLMTNYQFENKTKVIYSNFVGTSMARYTDPIMIVQSITKIHEDIMGEFIKNKVCYNLLNTVIGDFERGIIGLPQASVTSIACSLLRCMERHEIPKDPKSVESILPAIDKVYHDYIKQSYPLVDIQLHSQLVQPSALEKIKAQMIDLYDIDSLASITINGLNLLELL